MEKENIVGCNVAGVHDFDSLMQAISSGKHDLDLKDFEKRMGLESGLWDWDEVHDNFPAQQIDDTIHRGLG